MSDWSLYKFACSDGGERNQTTRVKVRKEKKKKYNSASSSSSCVSSVRRRRGNVVMEEVATRQTPTLNRVEEWNGCKVRCYGMSRCGSE